MTQFLLLSMGGLRIGAVYALSALGLVVIHKATKTVNFAHGAYIMLGSYGAYIAVVRWGLPYWLVYLIVPAAVGLLAAFLEYVLFRHIRIADAFTVVITTVFVSILITEWIRIIFESDMLPVPSAVSGAPFRFGPLILTPETGWIVGGALSFGFLGAYIFARAPIGRAMRAMASNMRGAQLCGYSVDGIYAQTWFLGGGLAGLAGVFAAPRLGVSPELAAATIVPAFVAAIIGGFDSLGGAILGGLMLGLLETYTAAYLSDTFKNPLTFVLLLAVLLFKPEGLFAPKSLRGV
jgi:branched-chain amino acid transport system permease protein